MAKKPRSFMHLIFFMLKKGISKAKLLTDLTTMIKRSKIAGKSLHHLLHHHHHPPSGDYEFTFNNTPPYPLSLFSTHNHHHNKHRRRDTSLRQPDVDNSNDDMIMDAAVMKALEEVMTRAAASPEVGRSPVVVERLRITDSPFPVSNGDGDGGGGGDGEVDEAADKFIMRFYSGLRREN